MNCYYHNNDTVVGICPKCGKFLCRSCIDTTVDGLCPECYQKQLIQREAEYAYEQSTYKDDERRAARTDIILALIGLILGLVIYIGGAVLLTNPYSSLVMGILLLLAPLAIYHCCEWITNDGGGPVVLILLLVTGLLVFPFVFFLFAAPYYTIKAIKTIRRNGWRSN